jgi:hypothetical protein
MTTTATATRSTSPTKRFLRYQAHLIEYRGLPIPLKGFVKQTSPDCPLPF